MQESGQNLKFEQKNNIVHNTFFNMLLPFQFAQKDRISLSDHFTRFAIHFTQAPLRIKYCKEMEGNGGKEAEQEERDLIMSKKAVIKAVEIKKNVLN